MITECGVQVTVYQCLPEGGAVAVLQTFTDEDVRTSTSFVSIGYAMQFVTAEKQPLFAN